MAYLLDARRVHPRQEPALRIPIFAQRFGTGVVQQNQGGTGVQHRESR